MVTITEIEIGNNHNDQDKKAIATAGNENLSCAYSHIL